jgi:hypothetical protein
MFSEVQASSEDRELAKKRAAEINESSGKSFRPNSHRHGDATKYGTLGEILFLKLAPEAKLVGDVDYDIVFRGYRIEVKTRHTTVYPRPNYAIGVFDSNTRQDTDFYVFMRVAKDGSKGWFMGFLPKADLESKTKFVKQGERHDNLVVHANCWIGEAKDCYPLEQLLALSPKTP